MNLLHRIFYKVKVLAWYFFLHFSYLTFRSANKKKSYHIILLSLASIYFSICKGKIFGNILSRCQIIEWNVSFNYGFIVSLLPQTFIHANTVQISASKDDTVLTLFKRFHFNSNRVRFAAIASLDSFARSNLSSILLSGTFPNTVTKNAPKK